MAPLTARGDGAGPFWASAMLEGEAYLSRGASARAGVVAHAGRTSDAWTARSDGAVRTGSEP